MHSPRPRRETRRLSLGLLATMGTAVTVLGASPLLGCTTVLGTYVVEDREAELPPGEGPTGDGGVSADTGADSPAGELPRLGEPADAYAACAPVLVNDLVARMANGGRDGHGAGQLLVLRWMTLPAAEAWSEYSEARKAVTSAGPAAPPFVFNFLVAEASAPLDKALDEAGFRRAIESLRTRAASAPEHLTALPSGFVTAYAAITPNSGALDAWERCMLDRGTPGLVGYLRNDGSSGLRARVGYVASPESGGGEAKVRLGRAPHGATLSEATGEGRVTAGYFAWVPPGPAALPLTDGEAALEGLLSSREGTGLATARLVLRAAPPGREGLRATCLRYYRTSPVTGVLDTGLRCSVDGSPAPAIPLGDDTGWKARTLTLTTTAAEPVCMRFSAVMPDGVAFGTTWLCSQGGATSGVIALRDDNVRDQKLEMRVAGPRGLCLRHTRKHTDGRPYDSGVLCSRDNTPIVIPTGDGSGWKEQTLTLSPER